MAGRLYQRGAIYYIAYRRNGRELRESTRSTDPAQAAQLLEQRLAEAAATPGGPILIAAVGAASMTSETTSNCGPHSAHASSS